MRQKQSPRPYTPREDEIIRRWFRRVGPSGIARIFREMGLPDRLVQSISCHAINKLGIEPLYRHGNVKARGLSSVTYVDRYSPTPEEIATRCQEVLAERREREDYDDVFVRQVHHCPRFTRTKGWR